MDEVVEYDAPEKRIGAPVRDMTVEERLAWYWDVTSDSEEENLSWLLLRWRVDPVLFAIEALRIVLQPYQAAILLDLANAPLEVYEFYGIDPTKPKSFVTVPSGHGLGKTRVEAVASWWHQICFLFSKTIVTAPTADQITGQLFGEIRKLFRRLKKHWPTLAEPWEVHTSTIRHTDPDNGDWCLIARTSRPDRPESMQGAHGLDDDDPFNELAELFNEDIESVASGGILVIKEEASGIPDNIFETLEGALSEEGAMSLECGNPTRNDGKFAEHAKQPDRYAIHQLDCRMSDRTKIYYLPYRDFSGNHHQLRIRGFVRPSYWENIIEECDGDEDHDRVRVRVRGMIPRSNEEQILLTTWIDACYNREPDKASIDLEPVIGLDFGLTSDKHAIAVRQGYNIRHIDEWLPKEKPAEITLDAVERAKDAVHTFRVKGKRTTIIGDANGVGRGAMEVLSAWATDNPELRVTVIFFNSGAEARDSKRYYRLRDEMWHREGRRFFSDPRANMPKFPGLTPQLTAPTAHEDDRRKIKVLSKSKIEKQTGQKSGNAADAILETLMVNVIPEKPKPAENNDAVLSFHPIFQKHFQRYTAQHSQGIYIR